MAVTRVTRTDNQEIRSDGKRVLGDGSARIPARLTRVGVFVYQDGQGGEVRELRHPDEVFNPESLDSLRAVTVTEGHPTVVDGRNWKSVAIGHVGDDVKQDGIYVASDLIVKDADVVARIDARELVELSCGYSVDLDFTPGEYEGERYDAVQRNIRYNHVGIGPEAWGRAGSAVKVLLDSAYAPDMSVARTDAPSAQDKEIEALKAERDAEKARADKAEGERDAAKADAAKARTDAAGEAARMDSLVEARVALIDSARAVLGADYSFKGKSARDIRIAVLTKLDATFDAKDRADVYLEARCDAAFEGVTAERKSVVDAAVVTTAPSTAPEKDLVSDAHEAMLKRNRDAWKGSATSK